LNILKILSRFNQPILSLLRLVQRRIEVKRFDRSIDSVLFRPQRVFYPVCDGIQFPPFGFVCVMRAKPDTESISHVTGKHVQMNMKYFLPCRLAVSEEEIHSFAPDLALIQCRGKTLGYAEHMRALFLVQIHKARGMSVGNYKRMSGIDGLNIHESRAAFILINHADLQFASKYLAKYAVIRLAHDCLSNLVWIFARLSPHLRHSFRAFPFLLQKLLGSFRAMASRSDSSFLVGISLPSASTQWSQWWRLPS
jgi:hypothetical protein